MISVLIIMIAALVGIFGGQHPASTMFGTGGALVIALSALCLKHSILDTSWWVALWVIVWATISLAMKLKILMVNGLSWFFLPGLLMVFPIYILLLSIPAMGIIWWVHEQENKKKSSFTSCAILSLSKEYDETAPR
jgi:hypothetical protein